MILFGLEFFDNVNVMIEMRTKSIIITNTKCPSVVPMVYGLTKTKSISTIQLVDEGLRVEELATKSNTKPQPLEKPNKELWQPIPTQSKMPTHVLFPEKENFRATWNWLNQKKSCLWNELGFESRVVNKLRKEKPSGIRDRRIVNVRENR